MQYEFNSKNEFPHVYTFDLTWEISTIQAAFRESIFNRAAKGNSGSVSEWDAALCAHPKNAKVLVRNLRRPEDITDILYEFEENTDDSITKIPDETGVAAFENDRIGRRLIMGRNAGILVTEMLKACATVERSAAEEQAVNEFRRELDAIPEITDDL